MLGEVKGKGKVSLHRHMKCGAEGWLWSQIPPLITQRGVQDMQKLPAVSRDWQLALLVYL